jgi:CHAT domain-containing protein
VERIKGYAAEAPHGADYVKPIDPQLKAVLDQLGLEPTEQAWERLNAHGLSLYGRGQLDGALDIFRIGWMLAEHLYGSDHPYTLTSMGNLAQTLRERGDLRGAEALQRRVLEASERTLPPDHPDTLTAMNNLAVTIRALGDLPGAESLQRRVLEASERTLPPDHPDTLTSMGNLAATLYALGELPAAEALMDRAVSGAEHLRATMAGVAERAMLAGSLHLSDGALVLATLRARLDRDVSLVLSAIESGTSRSVLDLLQSNAVDKRAAAAERVRTGRWSEAQGRGYTADLDRMAELEFHEKQLLDQGVPLGDPSRVVLARELLEVRQRLVGAENELLPSAQPRELMDIRTALRPGEVLLVYGWSWLGVSLVAVPHADLGEVPSAHWVSKVDDAPTPLETAKRELDLINTMQSVAVLIAAGLAPEPARAMQVAMARVTVEADAVLTARLGTTSMQDTTRLVVGLQTAADAMAKDPKKKLRVPSMPIDSLGSLSRALLEFALPEKIRSLLGRASRVIVVPSGPLHELPLEVLVELANFAELKSKPVTLVPSGSILALIRSRGGNVRPDGITAVGDPDFDLPGTGRGGDPFHVSELDSLLGERAEGQGRLPRARTEAKLVAEYRGGSPLIDADATPSRLRAEAPGKRVLHIAAHAVLGAKGDPMASAILLSREAGTERQRSTGRLSVGDLIATWGDRLKGCELAVLSCCQTGRGVQVGDSVMALPVGILHAGVNAIVASLWKVDDLATCLLMKRFHENMLGDHRTLSEEIDDVVRKVWGKEYRGGQPMPMTQALAEAKTWLQQLPSEALSYFAEKQPLPPRHFTNERGDTEERRTDVQIAQQRAALTGTTPFAYPCYWAAFVVFGDAPAD